MKRARIAGRRMMGINNQGQTIRSTNTRRRRNSRRSYRRSLYNYSRFMPRYRVSNAGHVALTTPTNTTHYTFQRYITLAGLFTPATHWVQAYDSADIPTDINAPVYVRGGEEKFVIASESDEAIEYKIMLVWIKKGATLPTVGDVDKGYWIGTSATANETIRVMRQWEGTLSYKGGSATFIYKPKMKIYKDEYYSNGFDTMWWFVFLGNTVSDVANDVVIQQNSSITVGYLNGGIPPV